MALTIEDGSIIAGANSYVTLVEARAFASARGITLPAEDATAEILAIKAVDFLEAQRNHYEGAKLERDQPLQWPRQEAYLDGFEIYEDEIPDILKNAQCQLMMDVFSGLDLQPNGTGREVVREKIDVLETEYAQTGSGVLQPIFAKAMAYLEPLFGAYSSPGNLPIRHA